ncbi:hypothetical protein KAH55_04000, partial [bacterium]|nr:hypothetical protein [bacterium]
MRRLLNLTLVVTWVLLLILSSYAQDTLRIVTYNLLKLSDNVAEERFGAYYNVLSGIEPDILVTQELINEAGAEKFLDSVLNKNRILYSRAHFCNGPDTDNSLFYKSDRLELLSQRQIPTALRDISEYVLRVKGTDSVGEFRVFSVHLKASSGSSNQV